MYNRIALQHFAPTLHTYQPSPTSKFKQSRMQYHINKGQREYPRTGKLQQTKSYTDIYFTVFFNKGYTYNRATNNTIHSKDKATRLPTDRHHHSVACPIIMTKRQQSQTKHIINNMRKYQPAQLFLDQYTNTNNQ